MSDLIVQQDIATLLDQWLQAERAGSKFPVPFDSAWPMAGYGRKSTAKRDGLRGLKEGREFCTEKCNVPSSNASGSTSKEFINLSLDGLKHLCLMAETEEGYAIRQYFIEAEKPRLKIVPRKMKASAEMRLLKQMLDMVPGLDETRKAATMFGHMAIHHPETAAIAQTAIAALPAAPATEKTFTPTEIGGMLAPAISARAMNIKLIDAGLQGSYQTAKGALKYKATVLGAEYSVLTVEAKADGTPTESLRWKESVIEQLSFSISEKQVPNKMIAIGRTAGRTNTSHQPFCIS